ncbi:hypothetical protein [Roseibium sp. RKSG952]|uniref:hypothetical protein n=1 Tax=Roseibium sp. RKSG952 TaxID=2529384 RepID=UPI0012BC9088|nr:hypothetical protein [Roseibium sp. RKSG952]MTH95213.1 hypothetical protein [Roseibium sp. RKSG952]
MLEFNPFEDDRAEMSIGNMSVENSVNRLLLHGDIEFGHDETSLSRISSLIRALADQMAAMEVASPALNHVSRNSVETDENQFMRGLKNG